MEFSYVSAAFVVCVVIIIFFLKGKRPTDVKSDNTVEQQEKKQEKDSKDIYAIAESLSEPIDQLAHPKDTLSLEQFNYGVKLLSSGDYTADELIKYCLGHNWIISCMAFEALSRQKYSDDIFEKIIDSLSELGPWPMFFALRCLDAGNKGQILNHIFLMAQDWWLDSAPVKQLIGDLADRRIQGGEHLSFGGLLDKGDEDNLRDIKSFIKSLRREALSPFVEEIENRQETRVDRKFLESVGRLWDFSDLQDIIVHDAMSPNVSRLQGALRQAPRQSMLLIGESGVGKTSTIKAVAKDLHKDGWVFFEAGATDVMAGQVYIGELEGRVKKMIKALNPARKVIWYIPNFHELLYAGSHRSDPAGVLDRILPAVETGRIMIIGETTPESFERLSQARKRLRTCLETLHFSPLPDTETLNLARAWIANHAADAKLIDNNTLAEAYQLVKQHLTDKTSPGNLLHFLDLTFTRLEAASNEKVTVTLDDMVVTLSQLTGLPKTILDEREDLDLAALRNFFEENIMGQAEAINCLIERIAMLKAGLNDPTRPFGVFLFVGPTGTGKTEIAKKLAEALFGSAERMIRLDMSEYQTVDDLSRLLGETHDLQGNALVNQIRKQPFSVVLLDEFEKAHRNIWDLFLQVFDDGRLTDRSGNLADFRHSIIILTSNLGSTIKTGSGIGFNPSCSDFSKASVEKAVSKTFRPEFVNRLDRVVIFHPLSRNVMRLILQRELNSVLKRRGFRNREWAVEWEESAIEFLLNKGFTLDMGARPLKRAIEQYLLSPLSITIVEHDFPEGDQFLFVRSDDNRLVVEFIDPDAPIDTSEEAKAVTESLAESPSGDLQLKSIALEPQGSQAEMNFLTDNLQRINGLISAGAWVESKKQTIAQMSKPDFRDSNRRFWVLNQIEVMDRIESGLQTASSLASRLSRHQPHPGVGYAFNLQQRLAEQLYLLEIAYSDLIDDRPHDAFLQVETSIQNKKEESTAAQFFNQIWDMYKKWARKRRMNFKIVEEAAKTDNRFHGVMAVTGFGAYSILEHEVGLHILESARDHKNISLANVKVKIAPQPVICAPEMDDFIKQAKSAFQENGATGRKVVRRYRINPSPLVRDNVRQWRTGKIERVLSGDFDLFT